MFRAALILSVILVGCSEEKTQRPLGEACAASEDCEPGLECLDQMPDGLCTRTCGDGCPDGSACLDLAGEGFCFPTCSSSAECREGYACSLGLCDLPCANDEECPEYAACDPEERGCRLRTDQELGEVCREDQQCGSGRCLLDDSSGFCTETCGGTPDCDAGLSCGFVVVDDRPEGLCRRPAGPGEAGDLCGTGSDCRSGACARGACVVPCGSGNWCADGATCADDETDVDGRETSADACQLEAAPGVRLEDLGLLATERGCLHIEFDAPDDIVSFAVVAWTADAVMLEPRSLLGPDDRELINDRGIGPIRVYDREREVTILVPNSDFEEAAALPGHYRIDFCAREIGGSMLLDSDIHVRLLRKVRPDGTCDHGEMTLNIHIAPGVYGPMSAANAAESPYVQDILERVRHYYEDQCNVVLGEVRYYNLDDVYGVIGTEGELHEMFEAATLDTAPASANVFLVRDLSGIDEWIAGISGGLPGPPVVRGTPHSGLALTPQESGSNTGDTLAHEVGHFFGLFHPTEMDGATQDPISDTPTCDFDPEDPWGLGDCDSLDNVMFPAMTLEMDQLTEGQCFVVRGYQGV
jgi:hypothetical protein